MKNIFAYTALGPSPAYCSINEDEHGVVIVTVRAKDGRESSVEIPKAEAALLQQGEPEGWREAKRIADLWFEPWGAAKAIEWEFSGDVPFTPENALRKIQRLLSASPLPPAPGAETGDQTPRLGPNWTSPKKHNPEASSSRQAVLEETLLKLCDQIESDLKSAHAEICTLQNLDPKTHTWPVWTQQANTLRWIANLRVSWNAALKDTNQ